MLGEKWQWQLLVMIMCIYLPVAVYCSSFIDHKQALIKQLYHCGAIRVENTHIKNGQLSPIYFDMRAIISYPVLLHYLAETMQSMIAELNFDVVCGVPYGAIPLATAIALRGNYPMIMQRKQVKSYGTQKSIEGVFNLDALCLIVEDVITTGSSILETINVLEEGGLKVQDVIVIIDREQGGVTRVQKQGYTVHAVWTVSEIICVLRDAELITHEHYAVIKQFCTEQAANN